MAFVLRTCLCRRTVYDIYAAVPNRWIFLVLLQAADFACFPIVASCQLRLSANCPNERHSVFVGTRGMLQHVPTRLGQGLCITSPHRILGVCVAAILPDPCVLETQGSRTSQRAKKPKRVVWLQIKSPF